MTPPQNMFQDFPDRDVLSTLSKPESMAIAKVLQMAVYADDSLSQEEVEMLRQELSLLPGIGPDYLSETDPMASFFERTGSHVNLPNPKILHKQLGGICQVLKDDAKKLATLRLVAELCASDGIESSELDFYNTLVDVLGYDMEVAEDVLRGAWASRQEP